MIKKGVERKILVWDKKYRADLRGNYWTFIVVDEAAVIKKLRQDFIEAFDPKRKFEVDSGETASGGLRYEIFSLLSGIDKVNLFDLYNGTIKRDESLRERKTSTDWNNLVGRAYRGTL
jgi:hypothetical protein